MDMEVGHILYWGTICTSKVAPRSHVSHCNIMFMFQTCHWLMRKALIFISGFLKRTLQHQKVILPSRNVVIRLNKKH